MRISFLALLCCVALCRAAWAQSVQPAISEYKGKASGVFEVANNTLQPMIVVLEPKSFSITAGGRGAFRPLDGGIHIQLSAESIRLEPKQIYHVFYKVSADKYPAWLTVYASFTAAHHGPSLDMRFLLPHTIYLYQKKSVDQSAIQVRDATYYAGRSMVEFDVVTNEDALSRVTEVRAVSAHGDEEVMGFPLLPHDRRHVELPWKKRDAPEAIALHFDHFTIRVPVSAGVR